MPVSKNLTSGIERRTSQQAEIRALNNGHIDGHAAVFGEEYVLWDSPSLRVVETIQSGSFKRALGENQDVRCLFNHDSNNILGRTASGTLTLEEDSRGLRFDCTTPDTQLGKDVRTSIQRKDLSGCSFAFMVTKQERSEEEKDGKTFIRRTIQDVDLFDVGPVTYPAYEGTDVKARALELRGVFGDSEKLQQLLEAALKRDDDVPAGDDDEGDLECDCSCRACYSAECEECGMHMQSCSDPENCDPGMAERAARDNQKKTKRVDGEDLGPGAFAYVGDPDKTETWKLPIKFSTEEKTASHIRNALARFEQTQGIPAADKPKVLAKIKAAAKAHGIHVSGESEKDSAGIDLELAQAITRNLEIELEQIENVNS